MIIQIKTVRYTHYKGFQTTFKLDQVTLRHCGYQLWKYEIDYIWEEYDAFETNIMRGTPRQKKQTNDEHLMDVIKYFIIPTHFKFYFNTKKYFMLCQYSSGL